MKLGGAMGSLCSLMLEINGVNDEDLFNCVALII